MESTIGHVTVEVTYHDPDLLWLPFNENQGASIRDVGGESMPWRKSNDYQLQTTMNWIGSVFA